METLQIENKYLGSRERYLMDSVKLMNDRVFKQSGYEVPKDVKVSCGFPASGGRTGSKKMTVGTCHNRASSKAEINEIYISPTQADSLEVLGILAHELIHAIDDCENGHKGLFRTIAVDIGLTGKMTATTIGDKLKIKLQSIIAELGKYPHAEVSTGNKKKQGTRMLKHVCEHDCGASCYQSAKQSDENPMLCSNCTTHAMETEELVYMVQA